MSSDRQVAPAVGRRFRARPSRFLATAVHTCSSGNSILQLTPQLVRAMVMVIYPA